MTVQFRADLDSGGQGLALQFPDGLTSISNSNDIQTITIGKASSFTLTVQVPGQSGPQTTAPIAVTTTPPGHYALLTAPLPSAGVATIGVAWQVFGDATPNALFEVFDGSLTGTRLAAVWLDQTQPAASSADADGQAYYLLPACTFSGATAVVRLTGIWDLTGATYLHLGGIKVTPQGGAATYYPFDGTAAHYTLAPADGWPNRTGSGGIVNRYDHGLGAGDCYSIDVAECQAKIAALTGVGVGNVAVAEWVAAGEDLHAPPDSDPTTANHFAVRSLRTHQITFQGAVGHRAFALMTASDANIAVDHTQVGGQFPALTVRGFQGVADGTVLPLRDALTPMRQAEFPVGSLYLPLPQYPAAQVLKGGTTDFIPDDVAGHWHCITGQGYPDASKGAYYFRSLPTGRDQFGNDLGGTGLRATALWDGQRAGTFSLSATWVADPAHTTAARYLIYRHDDALQATRDAAYAAATDQAGRDAANALPTTVEFARVTVDQTIPPVGATIDGVVWQSLATGLTLIDPLNFLISRMENLGADGTALCCDAVRLDRTDGLTSMRATADSTASLAIPADYWITNAGPVPAAPALPVGNSHGTELILIPGPGAATTLRTGHNLSPNNGLTFLPNYAIQGTPDLWDGVTPGSQAPFYADVDGDGNPTRMRGDYGVVSLNGMGFNPGSSWKGFGNANVPAGDWTFVWDGTAAGTSVFQFLAAAPATVAEVSRAIGSGPNTVNNVMVFHLDAGGRYGATISYKVLNAGLNGDGSRICAFKNLRIYPPGVDWHSPPRFAPASAAWLAGSVYNRAMDGVRTIGGNWTQLSELNRPTALSYMAATSSRSFAVSEVTNYAGPPVAIPGSITYQITTPSPHGIEDDRNVGFVVAAGDLIHYSNAGTATSFSGFTTKVSDTVFLVSIGAPSPMSNTLTQGTCSVSTATGGWNLIDFADLTTAAPGRELHLSLELSLSLQGAADIADFWLSHTPSGTVLCAEVGNEVWNTTTDHFWRAQNQGYRLRPTDGSGNPNVNDWWTWLLLKGGQIHETMRRRFVAAGRPNDFRRVFGCNYGNYGENVNQLLGTAAITPVILGGTLTPGAYPAFYTGGEQVYDHVPIDDLTMAPYVGVFPFNNSNNIGFANERPYNEFLTKDQILTLWSLAVKYGGFGAQFRAALTLARTIAGGKYASVRGTSYEGGLQNPVPVASFANYPRRCQEVIRDPRMFGLMLGFLADLQAGGCERIAIYQLQGDTPFVPPGAYWGEVQAWNERLGTGSPAENTDVMDLAHLYSQRAGATNAWNALAAGTVPITPLLNRIRLRWRDIFRPRLAAAVIPPPTITGITISPATLTMAGGTSHQFTAAVTGTGSYDPTVTWSRSPADGTMSSGGSFTAPAADHSADLTIDVIATAADGTHTATAVVTVPAEAVVIPPPATPAGLTVGATTSTSIALSWSAGGGGGPVGTYELDVSPHNANSWSGAYTGSAPTATATGLTASTPYDFRVKASNTSGSSAWSATVSGSTAAASVPAATGYAFTGPTAGTVGNASGLFTVTLNGSYAGTITITPSGDGLTTPIVLGFSNSSAPQSFSITPTSAGTATLTPTNSGGLTNPAAISFNATTVVTAGGTLATYTAAADAGTTFPSYASFPVVLAPGLAVTGLKVNNLATQTDVKTYWPDGSIKQAQVTALIPAAGSLAITEGPASAGTFPGVTAPAVTATLTKSDSTATTVTAPTTPTASLWLDGPLLKVYRSTVARGANGDTREFHVWLYADGSAHVEFLHGYELDGGNRRAAEETYAEVKLTVGGTTVATTTTTQPSGFPLNNYCNYSLLADVGGRSHVVVHPDTESWVRSGLMPRYRTGGLGVIGWANHGFGPMQRGWVDVDTGQDLNSDMGEVGGHPHIGLVPAWDAGYLSQPTLALYRALLGNAATAGSWPVHVRSAATATMVRIDAQPNYFFAAGIAGSDPRDTGSHNLPDVAHMANLAYTAYLLTGREYHLREVQNWANFALIANATGPRGGAAGLVWGTGQVRAYAWGFRQIAMAAVLSPDADPLHGYFRTAAINNTSSFDSYAGFHASTSQAPLATWLESEQQLPVFVNGQWDGHTYSFNPCTSQFQLAFLAQAIDYAISAGIPGGGDLLDGIINWYSCMYGSPDVCDLAYVGSIDYPTVGLNADPTTPTNSAWTLFQSWDDFARLALGRPPFTSSAAAGQPSLIGEFNASAFCAAMIGWRRNFAPLKHYGPTIEALLVSTAPVQIYASFAYARPLDTEILARPAIGPAFTVSPATVPAGTTTTVTLHGRPVVLGMTTWTRLTRINLGGPANQANLAPATADYVNQVLTVAVAVPAGASGTIPVTTTDDAPLASFNLTIG